MTTLSNRKALVEISRETDVARATSTATRLAAAAGFSRSAEYMVGTAVSELARNIFSYAGTGEVSIRVLRRGGRQGIEVVAEDNGPGIADIETAMKDGFSSSEGLGLGLPGAKRLMDEFHIDGERSVGTKITMRKWT